MGGEKCDRSNYQRKYNNILVFINIKTTRFRCWRRNSLVSTILYHKITDLKGVADNLCSLQWQMLRNARCCCFHAPLWWPEAFHLLIITFLRRFEYPIPETDNPPCIHFHDYSRKIGAPNVALYSRTFLVSQPLDLYDERLLYSNLFYILKGWPPCLRCFHHWGANLVAQEEGVSALSYEDKGRVCVFMWAQLEGELVPRVCTPQFFQVQWRIHLKVNAILVCLENTIFWFVFFYIWWRSNEIGCCFTLGISGHTGVYSCISCLVSADNRQLSGTNSSHSTS
jgi:hypothetical protein